MIKASVIPHNKVGLNNGIFEPDFTRRMQWQGNTHWMETNVVWKQFSEINGIELGTYDLMPPEHSDVLIHIDLPDKRSDLDPFMSIKGVKHLLLLTESPLKPYWFNKENHQYFDVILTYNRSLVDDKRYFFNPLSKSSPPKNLHSNDWKNRKDIVILNTNRYIGIKAEKTPFHYMNAMYSMKRDDGWQFSIKDVVDYYTNFLYEERRKLVRCAEKYFPGSLDIYGDGWNGRRGGWYYRLFPDPKPAMSKGLYIGEKIELFQNYRYVVAFENFRGKIAYFSEKMFDAFYGGSVPIYLGDENVTSYVPKECFVDARDFKNYEALLRFVVNSDERIWNGYRTHIDRYLTTDAYKYFLPESNARRITDAVKKLARNNVQRIDEQRIKQPE
jgi:hypothetical protein